MSSADLDFRDHCISIPNGDYLEAVKEDERNRAIQIVSKFITTACICDRCQTARAILDALKGENK